MPAGNVTFARKCVEKFPDWSNCDTLLRQLHVSAEGTIEDDGEGLLQVDFANKYLGGGVLRHGCVQEEIRFLICPEMIISRLFTEVLEKNESLIMTGCERFSDYNGYADTFQWAGDYQDKVPRDDWGRIYTQVVAIDALVIHDYKAQFQKRNVLRELNKAYVGFLGQASPSNLSAICTGNWGCGAFGGDKRLKALIQLLAAAEAKRDMCYFTFEDESLRDDLYRIHKFITDDNPLSIESLLLLIQQYSTNVCGATYGKPKINLYKFIVSAFDGSLDETDEEDTQRVDKDSNYDSSDSLETKHLMDFSDSSQKETENQESVPIFYANTVKEEKPS